MKEELFNYFTTDNISGKKCTEKWLSKNNLILYNQIIEWSHLNLLGDLEFKRKVYHFIIDSKEIPVCLNCNNEVKYRRLKDGYQPYCSSLCQNSCSIAKDNWLKSWKKGNSNNEHIVSRNKTVIEKYGNIEEYNKHIQKSIKETCLKKYGVEYATQTDFYKKNRKKILKERYGSETYNNPDKTKRTRIDNNTQINDEIINDFLDYKKIIVNRTTTIYRNNENIINPEKFKRGKKDYHIDHLFSIKQGFLENLPIEIISHPCNLHMIFYMENLKKQDVCWITKEDLLNNIILYNDDIYLKQKNLKQKYSNIKEIAKQILDLISSGPMG
jgi:hypothetical protein